MPLNVNLQRLLDRVPGASRLSAPYAALARWQWRRMGSPPPAPPGVKRAIIRAYAQQFGVRVLVETGTFLGDTVKAMEPHFDVIYSIELSEALHRRAMRRFAGIEKVRLLRGDSAAMLPRVLGELQQPALFWLDGHYSAGFTAKGVKETPIAEELEAVLGQGAAHVVLVDDARLFDGTHDYPSLPEVMVLVRRLRADYAVSVADDIIRAVPAAAPHGHVHPGNS